MQIECSKKDITFGNSSFIIKRIKQFKLEEEEETGPTANRKGTSHVPLFDENYDVDCFTEERVSKDLITDSRGKNLLEFCIGNQLRILNGRMCGDSTGKFTCFKPNGCSVVDYALVSQSLLQQILYFNVSDFKANFSDCHCKITFKILASFQLEKNKSHMKDFPLRYKWDTESIQNFQESFTHPVIQNELKYFLNNKIILDKKNVNDATYSIHSIYEKVCKVSLKKKKKRVKTCNHKKWFDQDLKSLKKHVNDKAILMSKFPKDPIVRGSFFKLNKQFAKLRRKKKREFRENILDRLSNLESENPKDYWNLVNQLRLENNSETKNNIDGDIWYKYFSDLSSIPENEHIKSKIKEIKSKLELLEKKNFGFSEIDFKITPGELQKALRQLKSGKSPGLDTITNEMLKVSQSYMQDCLLKLFNAILLSGIYPNQKDNGDITLTSSNPHRLIYCQWQRESSSGQFEDLTDRDKYKNRGTIIMTIKSFNLTDCGSYRCKCHGPSKNYKYSSSVTIGKFLYYCF
ncbi:unnamed protein product [Mytilus edulis]|uniref:Ig-like domain-containing protein n=1 Tax=Mytilus edulis TaxID=6550 RepID=A0A8S3UZR7_MYTED|nr:unnamed protein product [Mytilus edulis]